MALRCARQIRVSAAQRSTVHEDGAASSVSLIDPVARTPYVRRFEREHRAAKWRPIESRRAIAEIASADVVLLGEYHPLPSAARTAMELLASWRAVGARCALGLEMVYARDQRVLDDYLAGRIGEEELRRRIRYREEWGYPWSGPGPLLRLARRWRAPVVGLDIPPRGGAAELGWRDRVAAARLARLLDERRDGLRVAVLYGEAHLGAGALPARLAERAPGLRVARVFHDLALEGAVRERRPFWRRAGRLTFARQAAPPGARGRALSQTWRRWAADIPAPGEVDLGHLVHGLIEAQAELLGIDPRRRLVAPALWLADRLPEVFDLAEEFLLARILRRCGRSSAEREELLARTRSAGVAFDSRANIVVLSTPAFDAAALGAAHWLASALRPPALAPAAALEATLASALALTVDPAMELEARLPGLSPEAAERGRDIARAVSTGRLSPARLRRLLEAPLATEADVRRVASALARL